MNSLQQDNFDMQNDASNSFSSNFLPEFVHRKSIKPVLIAPSMTPDQKLQKFEFQLFNALEIITPTRMRPLQLKKELKNYQFEKVERKIESQSLQKFGRADQQLLKEQQNLIIILSAAMKGFKSSVEHNFYIISKKGSRVYHFRHQLNKKTQRYDSFLTICNLVQKMQNDLSADKIPFQKLHSDTCEKILIKNQGINIFWGGLINKIIQNEKHHKSFSLIANFMFLGGMEVYPIQMFNGIENDKKFAYIAKPSLNILGEQISEVFRMKIAGIWTVQNVKAVVETLKDMFGDKYYDVELQLDRVTQSLAEQ